MTRAEPPPPVVAIVGPTAAGKSALSLDLAEALGGEVVNTDSMQVYRGMDIGTAKLPPAERRGVPHHLLDVLDVSEPATVAQFQTMAREVIDNCRARGVSPILVGGSALYTRATLDRFEFPGTDPAIRRQLEDELEATGAEAMHGRLVAVDASAAAKITPANGRRVVRALEVIAITGRPFDADLPELRYYFDGVHQIGVDIDRVLLDERIAVRVQTMWDAGLVEEVRRLKGAGLAEGRTASRALGYAQVLRFLAGDLTENDAKLLTVTGTRRFARRQDGWFRKDPRITWVGWDDPFRLGQVLRTVGEGGLD